MEHSEPRRGRIQLSIGNMSFDGEGDQDWLDQHIHRLLEAFGQSQASSSVSAVNATSDSIDRQSAPTESLASYIKSKGGDVAQIQRFLATAGWLNRRGKENLTTSLISKALQENQQKRLGNPSDSLNKNVAQGYCEKKGKEFFITPEGLAKLGETP